MQFWDGIKYEGDMWVNSYGKKIILDLNVYGSFIVDFCKNRLYN